jgi:hypothetical protein
MTIRPTPSSHSQWLTVSLRRQDRQMTVLSWPTGQEMSIAGARRGQLAGCIAIVHYQAGLPKRCLEGDDIGLKVVQHRAINCSQIYRSCILDCDVSMSQYGWRQVELKLFYRVSPKGPVREEHLGFPHPRTDALYSVPSNCNEGVTILASSQGVLTGRWQDFSLHRRNATWRSVQRLPSLFLVTARLEDGYVVVNEQSFAAPSVPSLPVHKFY